MSVESGYGEGTSAPVAAAFAESANRLQRASNLLVMLNDEQLWRQMLAAGLPEAWRAELVSTLAVARADYRNRWEGRHCTVRPSGTLGLLLPPWGASIHSSGGALDAVLGRISAAGCQLFRETESLACRFAEVAPGQEAQFEPRCQATRD